MKTTERLSTMSGTVSQINPQARQLTIEGLVMNKTFEIAADVAIGTESKPQAALSDLKVGDDVDVMYEQHGTAAVAHGVHPVHAEVFPKAA